ncbi:MULTISPECIES: acylglycerol kinase family protein [Streptomyces]|uniref:Diacylglycerol kinase n=1 Tax=Streptomyces koelreuteriae TaxID=2838015 RepID=A0ABX8FSG0_9ACTN|nr:MULTISPECIES: acylglycerol kinase family protein [Streptomyces]QWB24124.1 diacylglycerol kinase [Streptomyces koelreuteriae]UUA07111.1 acylglycerol kinase family protein [Streptomyces koelreuteriae]UUA14740.1 acylglycerol kinase family protein [Streptomyces sp. CRCS-T-1]
MAEVATSPTSEQLLVVIDPVARRTDNESVRIAKDVLSGGAGTKVCLPEGPEEFARALARRGSRRPVVVGDDRALIRAVSLLHRHRELAGCALSVVPVGDVMSLARSLGVPTGTVAAARAVLDGVERRMDLMVDDSDGVVLGALRIPPLSPFPAAEDPEDASGRPWLRTCQSLVRTLVPAGRPSRLTAGPEPGPSRLRVEVDGETLVDLNQPVEAVSVSPTASGTASVEIRPASVGAEASPLLAQGRTVTVSGAHFRYRADTAVSGPVRTRTWRVREGAWGLTVPAAVS